MGMGLEPVGGAPAAGTLLWSQGCRTTGQGTSVPQRDSRAVRTWSHSGWGVNTDSAGDGLEGGPDYSLSSQRTGCLTVTKLLGLSGFNFLTDK